MDIACLSPGEYQLTPHGVAGFDKVHAEAVCARLRDRVNLAAHTTDHAGVLRIRVTLEAGSTADLRQVLTPGVLALRATVARLAELAVGPEEPKGPPTPGPPADVDAWAAQVAKTLAAS